MFTGGVTGVSVSAIGHLHKLTCLVEAGVAVFRGVVGHFYRLQQLQLQRFAHFVLRLLN